MLNANTNSKIAIHQAAQQWGRRYYTLICWHLDETKFTYDVMADTAKQAVQNCLSDNPQDPANPYIVGKTILHIPVLGH